MASLNQSASAVRRISPHPLLVLLTVIVVPVLWLLFVATANPHELLVGAASAIATIAFTLPVCRLSSTSLELRPRDLVQLWRIPWYILSGVYEITLILAKDLLRIDPAKSLYRVCGFDTSTHDPVRIARTVLAVAYTTTAPNFIVIGVDPAQSRMLFHQLEASSIPKMTLSLGAKS